MGLTMCFLAAVSAFSQDRTEQLRQIVVSGVVQDRETRKKIDNVSVFIPGTNIGTVSNADGSFTLKIPFAYQSSGIQAEHLGYRSSRLSAETVSAAGAKTLTVWMNPVAGMLAEARIRTGDPRKIIEEALDNVPANYSGTKDLFSAFYRETIYKKDRCVDVSEAIVDVLKSPYFHRVTAGERVRIAKGRRLVSNVQRDTLAVKLLGGPNIPVLLDFVKNSEFLFDENDLDDYNFTMEGQEVLDDRPQFAIRFVPRAVYDYPLYTGIVYIDQETLAFTRAEFRLDMSDLDKATRAILRGKPKGLIFKPVELSYIVSYKVNSGKSYLNYLGTNIRFKCDWKKRLFSSNYATHAELVMVDRKDDAGELFSRKEAFSENTAFIDTVESYWDENFWFDYNIIEPTESLERAVGRLKRRAK